MVDPRDERLIHRLEAFSDIVIGFSMAFLALNLGTKDIRIDEMLPHITAFVACFGVVALLWWLHNRLFAYYFVANAFTIIVNFTALAGIAVFIFTSTIVAEKMLGIAHEHLRNVVPFLSLWMALYGIVLVLLGMLYGIGIRTRWNDLAYPVKRWGVARALNAGVGGIVLIFVSAQLSHLDSSLFPLIIVPSLLPLIAERWLTGYIVGKAPA